MEDQIENVGTTTYTQVLEHQGGGIEDVIADGIRSLMNISPVTTYMVLSLIVLLVFIKILLNDARAERTLNRDALNNSTAVISELKEMIRGAIHR